MERISRRSFVFASGLLGSIPTLYRKPSIELSGIPFRVMSYAHSPRRYLLIHGDENTARDVLSAYMNDHDGVGYLVTGNERNVTIEGLKVDPNRIFSRSGAEASLRKENPGIDPLKLAAVLDYLDKHREKTLKHLLPPKGSRLIALHNNREYSVRDEIASSDQTAINQPHLPEDFFLCTSPSDYDVLKQSPFNVVLQTKPDPDDGSLSRLAARRGVRYINLECAIGDYEGQMLRLRWLDDRLP